MKPSNYDPPRLDDHLARHFAANRFRMLGFLWMLPGILAYTKVYPQSLTHYRPYFIHDDMMHTTTFQTHYDALSTGAAPEMQAWYGDYVLADFTGRLPLEVTDPILNQLLMPIYQLIDGVLAPEAFRLEMEMLDIQALRGSQPLEIPNQIFAPPKETFMEFDDEQEHSEDGVEQLLLHQYHFDLWWQSKASAAQDPILLRILGLYYQLVWGRLKGDFVDRVLAVAAWAELSTMQFSRICSMSPYGPGHALFLQTYFDDLRIEACPAVSNDPTFMPGLPWSMTRQDYHELALLCNPH